MASRPKLGRSVVDVCADCGALDPAWASINKGILICDECCGVHRTLGRHISYVKPLRKGTWVPSQLTMVHALHSNGANSIWEHSLLDPAQRAQQAAGGAGGGGGGGGVGGGGRRKPQAKEPVKPVKSDFIRTKHQLLGFVHRDSEGDPSRQLHASVRTANLETSLRLLSCGADANYLHPEKGTRPLHVAAGAGQASQVELLLVYGADPGRVDANLKTPADHAREANYGDIAYRLVESQYELTDRISFYLCERRPDHAAGQHFLIPEMADSIDGSCQLARAAKRRLQMLPNYLFEEMAMDVFDEIDRRETENFWLSSTTTTTATAQGVGGFAVPFLPVNGELTATRNQARQKLGRLNAREFTALLIDLLSEAKRRQTGCLSVRDSRRLRVSGESLRDASDEEPLYDSVASEDDFHVASSGVDKVRLLKVATTSSSDYSEPTSTVSVEAYLDIKEQLSLSNSRMQQLLRSNTTMQGQIGVLQNMVQTLVHENNHLKTSSTSTAAVASSSSSSSSATPPGQGPSASGETPRAVSLRGASAARDTPPPTAAAASSSSSSLSSASPSSRSVATRPFSMFEPREGPRSAAASASASRVPAVRTRPSPAVCAEVIRHTNVITKRIQEVFRTVQERRQEQLEPCADRIQEAVQSMADMVLVQNASNAEVRAALQQLTESGRRLALECRAVVADSLTSGGQVDQQSVTQRIVQGAYDVAKATKQMVTLFQ